jgi:hypothetical protein
MPGCSAEPSHNPHPMYEDTAVDFSVLKGPTRSSNIPALLAVFLAHVVVWIGGIVLLAGPDRVSLAYLGDASSPTD